MNKIILFSIFFIINLSFVDSKSLDDTTNNTLSVSFSSTFNDSHTFICLSNNRCVGSLDSDKIKNFDSDKQIFGLSGNDQIEGSERADTIIGMIGNDNIVGLDGDDVLYGDEIFEIQEVESGLYDRNDYLSGGPGKDTIDGGLGDDFLEGGSDGDILLGNRGSDYIFGDNGDDLIYGFTKHDSLDKRIDYIDCGDGLNDTAFITPSIDIAINCENILS